jgi:DMSO/TMAO reductase YedYZ heme-binding membrane subunit
MSDRERAGLLARSVVGAGALVSVAACGWVAVDVAGTLSGQGSASWMLGRASGFTAALLMWLLVVLGLLLSHPAMPKVGWPSRVAVIRVHVALAVFTLAFAVLHVVVLATDPWAQVGWRGALLPMASQFRPVAVTLGVLALWSALLSIATVALAGRVLGRVWWPIHKLAGVAFVLVWAHGLLAGSDSRTTVVWYLVTGAVVLELAVSRYAAKTAADRLGELVRSGAHATNGTRP